MMRIVYRFKGRPLNLPQPGGSEEETGYFDISISGDALGAGNYGTVYPINVSCSYDCRELPKLVIKIQDYDGKDREKGFINREAEFFRIVHGGIVKVFFDNIEHKSYIVMRRIPGRRLDRFLEDDKLPWVKKLKVLNTTFNTLSTQLHDKGIIHGDLNPRNILVHELPDGRVEVNFIDFGPFTRLTREPAHSTPSDNPSYYHPELQRGPSHTRILASPKHDIYALCFFLSEFGPCEATFKQYFKPLFHSNDFDPRAAQNLTQELLLLARIAQFYETLSPDKRDEFAQLATYNDNETVITWVGSNDSTVFTELSAEQLEINWRQQYQKIYFQNLIAYCCEDNRLVSMATESIAASRARLPNHLRLVSDAHLDWAKRQVKRVLDSEIASVLYSDKVLSFKITAEELREKLKPHLQSASNEMLNATIAKAKALAFDSLNKALSTPYTWFHLVLFIYGPQHLKALLSATEHYKKLIPTLSDSRLNELWNQVKTCYPNPRDTRVKILLSLSQKAVTTNLSTFKDETGIDLTGLTGDFTLEAVRKKIQSVEISYLLREVNQTLELFSDNENYLPTAQYWRKRIDALSSKEPSASSEEWRELSRYQLASITAVKAFYKCHQPSYLEAGYEEPATKWDHAIKALATKEDPIATDNEWSELNNKMDLCHQVVDQLECCKAACSAERYAVVAEYWQKQINDLASCHDASVAEWKALNTQIDLSYLFIDGLDAYSTDLAQTDEDITDFVLRQPDKHNLKNFFTLIAAQNYECEDLPPGCFFLCVLDNQPADDDPDNPNPLRPFLESADGLEDIFEQRLYLGEDQPAGAGLFDSQPSRAYRQRLLTAVKNYARSFSDELETEAEQVSTLTA